MYSIGEMSRISGLTVRALRLYHERAILVATVVNPDTGYRYYDEVAVERGRAIAVLRSMLVSLEDIQALLTESTLDSDMIAILERHRDRIDVKRRELSAARKSIATWIDRETRERERMASAPVEIREIDLQPFLVAAIRFRGRYVDCGGAVARLGRTARGAANGDALALFHDGEFMDDGADIECCMPVSRDVSTANVTCRELPGGRALTVIHVGPYETIGRSYARAFKEAHARNGTVGLPTREVYLKGPGMILKGNPASYVTDLQLMVQR